MAKAYAGLFLAPAFLVGFFMTGEFRLGQTTRIVGDSEAKTVFGSVCDNANADEKVEWCGNQDGQECNGDTCATVKNLVGDGTTHYNTSTVTCSNFECCDSYPQGLMKCKGS